MKKLYPKIFRKYKLAFSLLIFFNCIQNFAVNAQTVIPFTIAGTSTWICPAGVTSISAECWGGGGAGGGAVSIFGAGGGGGGGAYVVKVISVIPGNTYNINVGVGGIAVSGAAGGDGGSSWFGSASLLLAAGGSGGGASTSTGVNGVLGTPGSAGASIGTTKYSGGNGAAGTNSNTSSSVGGGGGSSAGTASNGNDASTGTPGSAPVGGGGGAAGSATTGTGAAATALGGGGAGAKTGSGAASRAGGAGYLGKVVITYTCSTYTLTTTSVNSSICKNTSATVAITGNIPVGSYTVTYNMSAPNAQTGLTATMTVTTAGTGSFNTSTIPNSGNTTITITNLSSGLPGTCTSAGFSNNTATVNVIPGAPTTLTYSTPTAIYCVGTAITNNSPSNSGGAASMYSVSPALTGGLSINPNTGIISGNPTVAASVANYTVTASNVCGSTTKNISITVNSPASIITPPASQLKCAGDPVTFSVTVNGTSPAFQWRKNGIAISGATSSSYTIASLSTTDAGNYDVLVTVNSCGTVNSSPATLTVNPLPTTTISGNTSRCINSTQPNITFTGANGTAPYTFTYNINNGSAQTITTASGNSITIPVSTSTAGTYTYNLTSVKDASSTGCLQAQTGSATVTITLLPTVNFSASPSPVCQGASSVLTAIASGGTPVRNASNNISQVISATGTPTVTSSIYIPAGVSIAAADITLSIHLIHSAAGDLTAILTSPCGGQATIFNRPGGNNNGVSINGTFIFSTAATTAFIANNAQKSGGTFNASFSGITLPCSNAEGIWTLSITDNANGDGGGLVDWSISLNSNYTTTFSGPATIGPATYSDPNNATATATVTPPLGSNTYIATTTDAVGCSNNSSLSLTVNPNPTVTPGGAVAAICQGGTTGSLSGSFGGGSTGAIWSDGLSGAAAGTFNNNAGNTLNTATYTASLTAPASVTLTLTTIGGNCGTATATKTLTINPNPTVDAGPDIDAICQGANTGSLGGSFGGGASKAIWNDNGAGGSFSNNGGLTPGTATYTASLTAPLSVKLTLITSGGSCGITSASKFLVINTLPTATISGTTGVCQNSPQPNVIFTGDNGNEPYTFTYTINNGPIQTVTTTSSASVNVAAPTDVTGPFDYELISVMDASSCIKNQTGTVLISVNPLPNPTLTGPNPICQGSTNLYSTEGGQSNYIWTIVGGTKISGGGSADNTVTVTWTSMGAKSITVNYTNSFGCTAATSATIVNDPAAVNPTITGPSPVCLNSTGNNYNTEAGKSDYTWTVTGGTITAGGSTTSNNIIITWDVLTGTKKITLNYADGLGCSAASATVKNITVNPLPTAAISGTASICRNSPQPNITFTGAGGTAPYTFTYTINSGSNQTITTVSGNSITLSVPTGVSGPFLYKLISVSDNSVNACSQNITGQSATVTVNPLPAATIAGTFTICQNDPQPTITFTGSGGIIPYTFVYTINGLTPALSVSTTSGNSVTVPVPTGTNGSFTYNIVSVTDANTCSQNITGQNAVVTIKPSPVVVSSPSVTGVCNVPSNVSIALSNPNNVPSTSYSWLRNNTGASLTGMTGTGSGTPIAGTLVNTTTTAKNTVFTIVATSGNGCTGSTTATVSVYPSLVASVIAESQIICTGSSAAPLNGTAATGGSGSFTYVWQQTADTIAGPWITAPGSTNSLSYTPPAQSRYYRLIATDGICGATISNIVQITKSADLGGSFNESGKPTAALCGESSFTYMVNSSSANAVFDDEDYYIKYTWQATPAGYVTGPSGSFGSTATCSVIIGYIGPFPIYYYYDCFPGSAAFQVHNATNGVVTINIVVTPHVYSSNGNLFCNLSPRTIPVSINPTPVITDKITTACSGVSFTVSPQNGIPSGDVVPASGTTYTWPAPVVSSGVTGGAAQSSGQSSVNGTLTNNSTVDKTATYTVTPSYGGCLGNTFKVTVTVKPNATLATASQVPPMCTGSAGIIKLTGLVPGSTNTINYSINGTVQTPVNSVIADGSGNATFNTRNLTLVDNGQVLTVTGLNNSVCTNTTSVSATLMVNPTLTWLGYSTDWTDVANWCGGIPSTTSNITIPVTGSGLYPVIPIGITAAVHNINIASGASIKLNGGTFQVSGSISNSGVFDASKGTVDMNGTALQTIIANTFMNNAVLNLKITNTSASGVKLGGPLDLFGMLSFSNGNDKLLNSGGYLNLRSIAAGTAMVTDITNNGVNTNNRITGNVVVERYYPGRRAWRLTTAPVSTIRTIFNEWQIGGMPASALPSSGTYITSPTGGNGLDVSLHYSLKKYNDTTGVLVDIASTNAPVSRNLQQFNIPDNIGYFMFVRGDRTPSLLNPYPITNYNITTLRDTGILQIGRKTFTAVNTGFMLVGNPYASPIDFSKLTRSGIPRKFWAWDPRLNNTLGAYVVVDGQAGNFIVTPGPDPVPSGSTGQDSIIQSSQAIFVQSTSPSATVIFNENSKSVKDNNSVFRPATPGDNPVTYENMRTNLYLNDPDTAILADGIYVQFSKDFSANVDIYDDVKFTNFLENFGIAVGNKTLTLERRQPVTLDDTIFFNLWNTTARKYQFRFSTSGLNHPDFEGYLIDNYLKNETKVDLNGYTNIDFSITNDAASKVTNRFMIVFRTVAAGPLPLTFTSVKAYLQNSRINVEWNVVNEINIKEYEVERSTDGTTFTKNATRIGKGNNNNNTTYQWPDSNISTGTYYYRICSIGADGKTALSNTVKVTIDNSLPRIFIYPNPVIAGDNINIHFINQPKGRFNIRLLDKAGKLIVTRDVEINGNNVLEKLPFSRSLAHANYQMEITRPNGSKTNIALLY